MMIRNKLTSPHGNWGADCDAWELLATPGLSVKHERMPPGTQEVRHHHARSGQFFFVLSGELVMEIEGNRFSLCREDGIAVAAGERHQARNDSAGPVEFLVVSSPPTSGDRFEES